MTSQAAAIERGEGYPQIPFSERVRNIVETAKDLGSFAVEAVQTARNDGWRTAGALVGTTVMAMAASGELNTAEGHSYSEGGGAALPALSQECKDDILNTDFMAVDDVSVTGRQGRRFGMTIRASALSKDNAEDEETSKGGGMTFEGNCVEENSPEGQEAGLKRIILATPLVGQIVKGRQVLRPAGKTHKAEGFGAIFKKIKAKLSKGKGYECLGEVDDKRVRQIGVDLEVLALQGGQVVGTAKERFKTPKFDEDSNPNGC